jgi:hypothetical protein
MKIIVNNGVILTGKEAETLTKPYIDSKAKEGVAGERIVFPAVPIVASVKLNGETIGNLYLNKRYIYKVDHDTGAYSITRVGSDEKVGFLFVITDDRIAGGLMNQYIVGNMINNKITGVPYVVGERLKTVLLSVIKNTLFQVKLHSQGGDNEI